MRFKKEMIELAAMSAVLVLLSIVGLVWDVASGLLVSGIDGIMLAGICLMMAGVFSLLLFGELRQAGVLSSVKLFQRKEAEAAAASTAPSGSPSTTEQSK
jgi:hypothetical protein